MMTVTYYNVWTIKSLSIKENEQAKHLHHFYTA